MYDLWFFFIVSINGLLLLHFCKWRMAGSRICLIVFFHRLHLRIATSTLLQMENVQVAVYALCFFFLVSINGLIFLHFHRPIIQESVSGRMHAPTPAHKDLKGAVDKERNPATFPRRYGQQDSDVTPAWEEASGWNHMFVPTIMCIMTINDFG